MAVYVAALLVAGLALLFTLKSRFQYEALPPLDPQPEQGEQPPSVTVIVPARNEETTIARVVESFPGLEVIVVDDHSTDATAERARAAGAIVISAPPLPRRWLGKPNACWAGAQVARGEWLLFVDADTWYEPGFVPALVQYVRTHRLAAASVFPRQVARSWAEKTLLPYAFGLYFCGVNADAVNDPLQKEALANGQCLLFHRDAYLFLQGHKAVAESVIEDVSLARLMKRHRLAAHVLRGEELASVRMYDSFAAIWRGFEKNSFRFLQANPGTGWQVVVASTIMTSFLPVAYFLASESVAAAGMFLLFPSFIWLPWYGARQCWRALPAIYLFQLIALSAMVKGILGWKTSWKGRRV